MSQDNCKWCGATITDDYEEILGEDETEDGTFIEEYQIVCKECLDKEMS